jgi:hypothetical protein
MAARNRRRGYLDWMRGLVVLRRSQLVQFTLLMLVCSLAKDRAVAWWVARQAPSPAVA